MSSSTPAAVSRFQLRSGNVGPRVIDQNVEAAEFLFDRFRNPRRVFRARHVAWMDARRSAALCDASRDRFERLFSPTREHHARAFLGKRERSGFADAASRAGDPRNLARQPLHAPIPFAKPASPMTEPKLYGNASRSEAQKLDIHTN